MSTVRKMGPMSTCSVRHTPSTSPRWFETIIVDFLRDFWWKCIGGGGEAARLIFLSKQLSPFFMFNQTTLATRCVQRDHSHVAVRGEEVLCEHVNVISACTYEPVITNSKNLARKYEFTTDSDGMPLSQSRQTATGHVTSPSSRLPWMRLPAVWGALVLG